MYATLGDIVFEGLKAFTGFETKYSSTIEQIARVANKPRLQQTGIAAREITLQIRLGAEFADIRRDVERLKNALEDAEPLDFTTGAGQFLGSYVLQEMTETNNHTTPNGSPLWVDLELSLIENPTETERAITEAEAAQTQSEAPGLDQSNPSLSSEVDNATDPIAATSKGVSELRAGNISQIERINEIENNPSAIAINSDAIAQTAAAQGQSASALETAIAGITSLVSETAALRANLSNSVATYDALRIAARARNLADLKTLRANLIIFNDALNESSAGLVVARATRL